VIKRLVLQPFFSSLWFPSLKMLWSLTKARYACSCVRPADDREASPVHSDKSNKSEKSSETKPDGNSEQRPGNVSFGVGFLLLKKPKDEQLSYLQACYASQKVASCFFWLLSSSFAFHLITKCKQHSCLLSCFTENRVERNTSGQLLSLLFNNRPMYEVNKGCLHELILLRGGDSFNLYAFFF